MLTVERTIGGKTIKIETNRIAKQANGSVVVSCGDSVVLVTATMGNERDVDFLPLSIDYVEKTYAAGRIPGGFFKREGRLGEKEILTCRVIDRPCRPLFPKGLARELQVIATVLSADPEVDTDVLALCGASTALTISDIPFDGPIAGVRVGRVKGELLINPSQTALEKSDLNFIVAGTSDAIVMVEGGAEQVIEKDVLEALYYAHEQLQIIIEMQNELREKIGKEKIEFVPKEENADLIDKITKFAGGKLEEALKVQEKLARKEAISAVKEEVVAQFVPEDSEEADALTAEVKGVFGALNYEMSRKLLFKTGQRLDGRDNTTVRPISIDVGWLPRTHGSSLFTRGETQGIVTATLGVESEAQRIDSLLGDERKTFMLHYNFPPFCVGEVRPMRGPGRREHGHGALAERAVRAVLPDLDQFPYTIRIVSEITESNGSSSMATVCGASLSLMDAGVPIQAPVAGIAMGLIQEGEQTAVLTDILGDEDHLGDMDFKVCGTEAGITALQMDIKIKGLKKEIMVQALEQAKDARLHILGKMNEAIAAPREGLSQFAPKIVSFKIAQDKIRDLIGPGGKVIKSIQETWGVSLDIQDDGTVTVAGNDSEALENAIKVAKSLTEKAEIGKIYRGIVKRIADFGAFVEILPGTDGLVHISQLSEERVNRVTDVLSEGDEIHVKVLEVDRMGKIRLSLKDAVSEIAEGAVN